MAEKTLVKETPTKKKPAKKTENKELRAILKTLKEMRNILDNMWRERSP